MGMFYLAPSLFLVKLLAKEPRADWLAGTACQPPGYSVNRWFDKPVLSEAEGLTTNGGWANPFVLSLSKGFPLRERWFEIYADYFPFSHKASSILPGLMGRLSMRRPVA